MKKILIFSLVVPVLASFAFAAQAQQGDIDTEPQSTCIDIRNNLRYRMYDAQTGGEVSELQDFLQSKGHLTAMPSGYFGRLTLLAVQRLQREYGFIASGYVGPMTRAKIKEETCAAANTTLDTGSTAPHFIREEAPASDPVITGVSQTKVHAGTSVTLYGRNFIQGSYVSWDGVQSILPTYYTLTELTFTVPQNATLGVHTIRVGQKGSAVSTAVANTVEIAVIALPEPEPVITSVSHTRAYAGTLVTLFGRNFTPGSYVSWDGNQSILPAFHTLTELSFTIPHDAALGSHVVRVGQKGSPVSTAVSNTVQIGVIARSEPVITSVSETRAGVGDPITLFGYNFDASSYVLWDGTQSITPRSYASNQLTFVVPQGAAPGTHTVQVAQKASPFVGSVANTVNIEVVLLFY